MAYWITVAGYPVEVIDDYARDRAANGWPEDQRIDYSVPALVGSGTDRRRGRVDFDFSRPVEVDGPLRGWGDIDCEVSYRTCGANVPRACLDALAAKVGRSLIAKEDR